MKPVISVRNITIGEGLPKICVPLTDSNLKSLIQSAENLSGAPFDFVEWRADFYDGLEDSVQRAEGLLALRKVLGNIPILFTIRTLEEGGQANLSATQYEEINRSVIESGLADLVDVELSKGTEILKYLCETAHSSAETSVSYDENDTELIQKKTTIIASKHNFTETPSANEIVADLCKMQELGADIVKYAVMPNCEEDVLTLLSASITMKKQHPQTPIITMSMGSLGAVSRICGSLSGSSVTFGTVGTASAPGQIPADRLNYFLETLSL